MYLKVRSSGKLLDRISLTSLLNDEPKVPACSTYPMCLTSPMRKNFDVLYVLFVSYVPNIWRTLRHLRAKNIWHALRTLRTLRAKNVGMLYVPYMSKILASSTCQKFTVVTYASYLPKILANRTWHMCLKYRHFSWNLSIFTVEELNCYHYSV